MIIKLKQQNYERVRPLFAGLDYHLVIFSIIEGNSPGAIYADDGDNPQTAFVWDPVEEGFYLAGQVENDEFNHALNQAILDEVAPETDEYTFNFDPVDWESKLAVVLKDTNPLQHQRKHFFFKEAKIPNWRERIPAGFEMKQIDADLLSQTTLKNHERIMGWVKNNWQSVENFLENGFGACLVTDDEITCWCIADFTAGNAAEIGIHTAEAYRQRGFATLTTTAAIEYARTNGIAEIGWHCWSSNIASANTAEAVGFVQTVEHPVYHAHFNQFNNWIVQAHFQRDWGAHQKSAECFEAAFAMLTARHTDAVESPWLKHDQGSLPYFYFTAACAWAKAGRDEAALSNLAKAVEHGWRDIEQLENEPTLRQLCDSPDGQAIVAGLKTD